MTFTIITLFPEIFSQIFNVSIAKRAQSTQKIEIKTLNLREFGIGKHHVVDDKPYGGGVGMVLRVDVLDRAIQAAKHGIKGETVILLDPRGGTYNQETAEHFSTLNHIILICGHYEGYDERVRKLIDRELSIGDYVLSGGEIPAMVVIDSVMRLIPGVLKSEEAHQLESFSKINNRRILEYPQYTRPEIYQPLSNTLKTKGIRVPPVLLSGDSKKIEDYRMSEALKCTKKHRPDLLR